VLVGRDARQVVAGDVAGVVAARLDAVQLHLRELREQIRHLLELRPVELDVLPRGEVRIAAVVRARHVRHFAQLRRLEQAIGHGDAQHRREALLIKTVAKPQVAKLLLAELTRKETARLIAELLDALRDERAVDVVVAVHAARL